MGGALLTSDGGPDRAVQEVFAPMGCTGSGAEVGVPSTVLVVDDPVTDCPISGAVEISSISNSVGHPCFTNAVA